MTNNEKILCDALERIAVRMPDSIMSRIATDALAATSQPVPDAEYGDLRALAEKALDMVGKSEVQYDFEWDQFLAALDPQTILSILDSRAQLAERVAVLEAALENIDLNSIEQYRMQMAGISTAALGYCPPETPVHPDYMTPALRDVQALYAKYAALYDAATPHPHADEAVKHLTDAEIQAIAEIDFYRAPDIGTMDERCRNFARSIERHLSIGPVPTVADEAAKVGYAPKPECAHEWQLQPHTTGGQMQRCSKCWIYQDVAQACAVWTSSPAEGKPSPNNNEKGN